MTGRRQDNRNESNVLLLKWQGRCRTCRVPNWFFTSDVHRQRANVGQADGLALPPIGRSSFHRNFKLLQGGYLLFSPGLCPMGSSYRATEREPWTCLASSSVPSTIRWLSYQVVRMDTKFCRWQPKGNYPLSVISNLALRRSLNYLVYEEPAIPNSLSHWFFDLYIWKLK